MAENELDKKSWWWSCNDTHVAPWAPGASYPHYQMWLVYMSVWLTRCFLASVPRVEHSY
jgi:hypothetical protein